MATETKDKTTGITALSKEDAEELLTAIEVAMNSNAELVETINKLYPAVPAALEKMKIPKMWREHIEPQLNGKYIRPCSSLVGGLLTAASAAGTLSVVLQAIARGDEPEAE